MHKCRFFVSFAAVMKRLLNWFRILGRFVRKEFIHIFRDMRTLIIILALPVALVAIFGFALTTDIGELRLLVITPERSSFINELAAKLDASSSIDVVEVAPPSLTDPDEMLRKRKIDAVLTFEGQFESRLIRGEKPSVQLAIDAIDPNMVNMGAGIIAGIFTQFVTDRFGAALSTSQLPTLTTHTTLLFNPEMKASYYFVPGIMGLVLMIVCAVMTSVSIVREKEYGSMELLLTGPVHPGIIITAKAIPYFLISCINIASILLLSRFVLKVPLEGSLLAITFISALFILVSLLLGLFISTITETQLSAQIASGVGLLLPVSMLSGMIFPIESMPHWLTYVSLIIPAKWYVEAIKKLMLQGLSWADVQIEIYVLLGMAVVLASVAILTFKNRLE